MKEQADSFMGFMSRVQYKNSEKTTLEMVLQPKGDRMKFEYDYGDSWVHDLWVKDARDYAPGEEPVIKSSAEQADINAVPTKPRIKRYLFIQSFLLF